MKICFGSNNQHKLKEISAIFKQHFADKLELVYPPDLLYYKLDPEETGVTLNENALIKAQEFFDATRLVTFADDTGLEIAALGGKPGVFSARFAGEDCSDAENRKKVLRLMKEVPSGERYARFRTVICFYDGKDMEYIEGRCEGKIITRELGENGFGYDSLFVPEGEDKTFAQMTDKEKNKISHRSIAVQNFIKFLKEKYDK